MKKQELKRQLGQEPITDLGVSRKLLKRKALRKLKKHPQFSYLVTMLFANGTQITDILVTKEKTFSYKNKTYYLYSEESFFDISYNLQHFYFFENYPVPINREIQVDDRNEPYAAVTPQALKDFTKGEYVKLLVSAQQFGKLLKVLVLIGVINVVVGIITAFMSYGGKPA